MEMLIPINGTIILKEVVVEEKKTSIYQGEVKPKMFIECEVVAVEKKQQQFTIEKIEDTFSEGDIVCIKSSDAKDFSQMGEGLLLAKEESILVKVVK